MKTKSVRESDYSPAPELCFRMRKPMVDNNPKQDLVNFEAHKKFGQNISICSQENEWKQISDVNQGL